MPTIDSLIKKMLGCDSYTVCGGRSVDRGLADISGDEPVAYVLSQGCLLVVAYRKPHYRGFDIKPVLRSFTHDAATRAVDVHRWGDPAELLCVMAKWHHMAEHNMDSLDPGILGKAVRKAAVRVNLENTIGVAVALATPVAPVHDYNNEVKKDAAFHVYLSGRRLSNRGLWLGYQFSTYDTKPLPPEAVRARIQGGRFEKCSPVDACTIVFGGVARVESGINAYDHASRSRVACALTPLPDALPMSDAHKEWIRTAAAAEGIGGCL